MVKLDVSSIGEYNEVLDREGYVLVRRMVDPGRCAELRRLADAELEARVPPLELEADVGYPGHRVRARLPVAKPSGACWRCMRGIPRSPDGPGPAWSRPCWRGISGEQSGFRSRITTA